MAYAKPSNPHNRRSRVPTRAARSIVPELEHLAVRTPSTTQRSEDLQRPKDARNKCGFGCEYCSAGSAHVVLPLTSSEIRTPSHLGPPSFWTASSIDDGLSARYSSPTARPLARTRKGTPYPHATLRSSFSAATQAPRQNNFGSNRLNKAQASPSPSYHSVLSSRASVPRYTPSLLAQRGLRHSKLPKPASSLSSSRIPLPPSPSQASHDIWRSPRLLHPSPCLLQQHSSNSAPAPRQSRIPPSLPVPHRSPHTPSIGRTRDEEVAQLNFHHRKLAMLTADSLIDGRLGSPASSITTGYTAEAVGWAVEATGGGPTYSAKEVDMAEMEKEPACDERRDIRLTDEASVSGLMASGTSERCRLAALTADSRTTSLSRDSSDQIPKDTTLHVVNPDPPTPFEVPVDSALADILPIFTSTERRDTLLEDTPSQDPTTFIPQPTHSSTKRASESSDQSFHTAQPSLSALSISDIQPRKALYQPLQCSRFPNTDPDSLSDGFVSIRSYQPQEALKGTKTMSPSPCSSRGFTNFSGVHAAELEELEHNPPAPQGERYGACQAATTSAGPVVLEPPAPPLGCTSTPGAASAPSPRRSRFVEHLELDGPAIYARCSPSAVQIPNAAPPRRVGLRKRFRQRMKVMAWKGRVRRWGWGEGSKEEEKGRKKDGKKVEEVDERDERSNGKRKERRDSVLGGNADEGRGGVSLRNGAPGGALRAKETLRSRARGVWRRLWR